MRGPSSINGDDTVPGYTIRRATVADAEVIAHHRVAMFRDMGMVADDEVAPLHAAAHAYLTPALASGEYLGWVVDAHGQLIAGGGMLIRRLPPRPGSPHTDAEAYVLNVYTEPEYRRRGLARRLMEVIVDWCAANAIARVSLHASDDGRGLYLTMGFSPTNEMRLELCRQRLE
jgi:GNAT superfamily N-acetyltransferase